LLGPLAFRFQHLRQHIAETVTALAFENDEAPGKQLAMIGRPRPGPEDLGELLFGRAGLAHRLGRTRAAGQQQVDGTGGRVIE